MPMKVRENQKVVEKVIEAEKRRSWERQAMESWRMMTS